MNDKNWFNEQELLSDKMILNALMVVDYYPRIYGKNVSMEREEAFVKVYNCLLDELVERGILEC